MKKNIVISSSGGSFAPRFPIVVLIVNKNKLYCNFVHNYGYSMPQSIHAYNLHKRHLLLYKSAENFKKGCRVPNGGLSI